MRKGRWDAPGLAPTGSVDWADGALEWVRLHLAGFTFVLLLLCIPRSSRSARVDMRLCIYVGCRAPGTSRCLRLFGGCSIAFAVMFELGRLHHMQQFDMISFFPDTCQFLRYATCRTPS